MYQITELNTNARFGVSGLSTNRNIATACIVNNQNNRPSAFSPKTAKLGAAGLNKTVFADVMVEATSEFVRRDRALGTMMQDSTRLGDRAAREAWKGGVFFADFSYICTPYHHTILFPG